VEEQTQSIDGDKGRNKRLELGGNIDHLMIAGVKIIPVTDRMAPPIAAPTSAEKMPSLSAS